MSPGQPGPVHTTLPSCPSSITLPHRLSHSGSLIPSQPPGVAASSLFTSGRFAIDPELRGAEFERITQNLDVQFWKAFWNITEMEVLSVSMRPDEGPNLLQDGDTKAQRPILGDIRSLQGSKPRDGT